jgi:hypothetical protein
VLTVYSLVIMVALLLPTLSAATVKVLEAYDNVIRAVFLFDFGLRLKTAPSKRLLCRWSRVARPAGVHP